MLKVNNINVYYGNIYAIKDVTFQVGKGEIVTLIGANGAGKSTILKTISGLLRSKTGSIEFMDQSIGTAAPHKIVERGLAHVPEGRRIFLRMTVEENLEMGSFTQPKVGMGERMELVFAQFPRLRERRRQIAGTLSGGEQQMLAMGRALMSKPRLVMMDEPSTGLAPLIVRDIFQIILRLRAEGNTVLLIEQNAKAALGIADRGYVLEVGKVIVQGPSADLLANSDVQRAYLGREKIDEVA